MIIWKEGQSAWEAVYDSDVLYDSSVRSLDSLVFTTGFVPSDIAWMAGELHRMGSQRVWPCTRSWIVRLQRLCDSLPGWVSSFYVALLDGCVWQRNKGGLPAISSQGHT